MKTLQITLWLYATAFKKAGECVGKNWVVSFAPVAYSLALTLIAILSAPLGIVGGFLYSLASSACASSGLFLIKNMVDSGKTGVQDFFAGFTAYLWDVIGVAFILWLPMWAAANGLATVPNGALIYFLVRLALLVFLNVVPELIYQSRASGLELIGASYSFIVENWLEWLIPNLLLFAAGYILLDFIASFLYELPAILRLFVHAFLIGLGLVYLMTFRGFLFAQLHGTSRRSRAYRYESRPS